VSLLKRKIGESTAVSPSLPVATNDGELRQEPESILFSKWKKRGSEFRQEILVKWKRLSPEHNTWVDVLDFKELYPDFAVEGNSVLEEGGNVMPPHNNRFTGRQYTRRQSTEQRTRAEPSGSAPLL